MTIFSTQHKGKKTSQNVAFIFIPFLSIVLVLIALEDKPGSWKNGQVIST